MIKINAGIEWLKLLSSFWVKDYFHLNKANFEAYKIQKLGDLSDHIRALKPSCAYGHVIKLQTQFSDFQAHHLLQLLHTLVHVRKHPRVFASQTLLQLAPLLLLVINFGLKQRRKITKWSSVALGTDVFVSHIATVIDNFKTVLESFSYYWTAINTLQDYCMLNGKAS